MPAHKPFHAVQGFFDLAVFGCITSADKTFSAGTKGTAWYNSHAFFFQQCFGEGFFVHAGGADVGEGIKSAARLKGRETEVVKPATINLRRRSYSVTISCTCGSPDFKASIAASCAVVGADMIVY